MSKYMFTFGVAHPYRSRYVCIEALSMADAREIMFKAHGQNWSFGYTEKEFKDTEVFKKLVCLAELSQKDNPTSLEYKDV